MPRNDGLHYINNWKNTYADTNSFLLHQKTIIENIEYLKEKNIVLIALLFPFLGESNIDNSQLSKVEDIFLSNNVLTINLAPILNELKPHDRIVNANDAHPSWQVHKVVSDTLNLMLRKII